MAEIRQGRRHSVGSRLIEAAGEVGGMTARRTLGQRMSRYEVSVRHIVATAVFPRWPLDGSAGILNIRGTV